MISGFHTIVYSDDAEATRAFFRDVLGWANLDAHDGWLIFKTPPSELAVHPADEVGDQSNAALPNHQASLMCDDLDATIAELQAKGVTVDTDVQARAYGRVTSIEVPGAGWMLLYQPRHALAYELP